MKMSINDRDGTDRKPKTKFYRGLGKTLLLAFLAMALIPVTVVSTISYRNAYRSIQDDAVKALRSVASLKTAQIDAYFDKILADLRLQSQMRYNSQFLADLIAAYENSGKSPGDFTKSYDWARIMEEQNYDLKTFRRMYQYHDIYLIDTSGNILFSAAAENDLGTNLFEGPYAGTRFAAACQKALATEQPAFSDYEIYQPSGAEAVYGFFAAAILNDDGEKIGLIALQFSIDPINHIMQAPINLGKTAETYLIGPDLKMRSNSILSAEKTVLKVPVENTQTRAWKRHLDEKKDTEAMKHHSFNYDGSHGQPVLGTHSDIDIEGVPFGVVAEIEQNEIFASANELRSIMLHLLIGTSVLVIGIAVLISARIVRPVRTLSAGAKRVAEGDLDHSIEIRSKNEIGELTHSFNEMIGSLRQTRQENQTQNWYKTGQTQLNEQLRGIDDIAQLGRNTITFLAKYLDCPVGTLYLSNGDNHLNLVGSYAYRKRKHISNTFEVGEGLVGQAALEKESIILTEVPDEYIAVSSGLGQAVPRNILVLPFMRNGDVKGVVELGGLREFSETDLTFLNQVSESIAIAAHSAQSRQQMQKLLERTQSQAEELEAQQEELQQSNQELEKHTQALQQSEEKLQAEQEKLRQINEELEEQFEHLEKQKEQTEKSNKELQAAKGLIEEKARELELSSKYKSEFLANMSHELRTPLNSILLLSRLLGDNKDGGLSQEHIESAKTIYAAGAELLALINEILDLSKVEAGMMEFHMEDVNLKAFARDIARDVRPLALEKKLALETEVADGVPDAIHTDRQRITQVIKNFLSNALKFTTTGSIRLRIHRPDGQPDEQRFLSQNGFDARQTVLFSVIDTGIGIPEDKQQVIFEAFQQADGTTSRKYGGTGLGLSIAKEIAQLLGGKIRLKSRQGKGSTFSLYLPEAAKDTRGSIKEHKALPATIEKETPRATTTLKPEKPKTDTLRTEDIETLIDDRKNIAEGDKLILLIEDDPRFLKILMDMSRDYGFKCLVAGDGETGLQFAEYYKPSAIILDIGLPGIDGWAVMARLKENSETRHIPVHFISAFDKKSDALKMGAVDYLKKPVTPETMVQAFDNIHRIISKPVKDLLIAEDNPQQAQAIVKLIGKGDVRTTVVDKASEAYEQVLSGKFDCMILDLGLPDMFGIDLLTKMRNNTEIPNLPIIVYTARELTDSEKAAIDTLAQSTIIKGTNSPEKLLDETTLFLHRIAADLPAKQQEMLRMIHDRQTILADKNILVVDDDMRNVYSLMKVLEKEGLRVQAAANGREGIECLEKHPDIDLVLMDVMMPEMDGYEAMKAIRKQQHFKDLPIIALTAKAMKGDRAKCIQAGASDYLAKPVDVDRLISMLRVWLY